MADNCSCGAPVGKGTSCGYCGKQYPTNKKLIYITDKSKKDSKK